MKKYICTAILINCVIFLWSQKNDVSLKYTAEQNYVLTERTDLRRYDNDRYKGLVSREVKACIIPQKSEDGNRYEGYFYVSQDTKRNQNLVNNGIHDAISSKFIISKNGEYSMLEDCGYPSFRNFPSYPENKVNFYDSWDGFLIRSVDPLEKQAPTRIKSFVSYKFNDTPEKVYNNEEVYSLIAEWATRYNKYSDDADEYGDSELKQVNGRHRAEILISKKNGRAVLIRDYMEESYFYENGLIVKLIGNISMFTEYPPSIEKTIAETKPTFKESKFDYEIVPGGIKISLFELNFEPDTAILLEKDKVKLLEIAQYLKSFPDNKILIEGHTAKAGNSTNDYELSLERAHAVLGEFVKSGLKKENFICKGSGSDKPLADNNTEEGRAKNRRVEITILGDIK